MSSPQPALWRTVVLFVRDKLYAPRTSPRAIRSSAGASARS